MVKGVALAPTDGRRGSFASNRWLARPQSDSRSPWTSAGRQVMTLSNRQRHRCHCGRRPRNLPRPRDRLHDLRATTLDGITKSQEA